MNARFAFALAVVALLLATAAPTASAGLYEGSCRGFAPFEDTCTSGVGRQNGAWVFLEVALPPCPVVVGGEGGCFVGDIVMEADYGDGPPHRVTCHVRTLVEDLDCDEEGQRHRLGATFVHTCYARAYGSTRLLEGGAGRAVGEWGCRFVAPWNF